MEGIYSEEFQQKFNEYKIRYSLPDHIWQALEDTIGWAAQDMYGLDNIIDDVYVWNKPNQFKCPSCAVLFVIDKTDRNYVHICSFYDTSVEDTEDLEADT